VETLQDSRERVASRWFALKNAFEPGPQTADQAQSVPRQDVRLPALALFSLAGGTGKSSLVATLGRALSSLCEKVLLSETSWHGVLPYYFGATETRPGIVRTFMPPAGSRLVSYQAGGPSANAGDPPTLAQQLATITGDVDRVLLDLNGSSTRMMSLERLATTVLIPVAPDMNSVISLQTVEHWFDGVLDSGGRAQQPYYVLNQFDAALPLHLDVREVLRCQLGERLLPIAIRRSPAVSEALAEGMTVIDYAAGNPVVQDYMALADWIRSLAAPAIPASLPRRWSER
jgi:cellulose synthase operon protein YhjQ